MAEERTAGPPAGQPDDAAARRAERAERADYHVEADRKRRERESVRAQAMIDRFVVDVTAGGFPTQELTARPWSGKGRYKTGITGWYLRRDQSVGIGTDGAYYVLVVPTERFGRWRTVAVEPTQPPLQVGAGARDGESVTLEELLRLRLEWGTDPDD
jgi:hypothetical protein